MADMDLPEGAVDLGTHEKIVWPDDPEVKQTHLPGAHRIVAIPVPEPEPPSAAHRITSYLEDLHWGVDPDGIELMVINLGLVCRDDIPTDLEPLDLDRIELLLDGFRLSGNNKPHSVTWNSFMAEIAEFGVPARPTVTEVLALIERVVLLAPPDRELLRRDLELMGIPAAGAARPDEDTP